MENTITKIAFIAARHLESKEFSNEIISTKNNNNRDVVTSLDYSLNDDIKKTICKDYPEALILSEEDNLNSTLNYYKDLTFVIDPLDGSQNFSVGFPFYSSLVAAIKDHKIIASSIVTNFNKQLFIWDKSKGLKTNLSNVIHENTKPTYLAYSPIKTSLNDEFFYKIIRNIDEYSTGLYRWGSASNGLIELINGRLQTFIAYEVRVWDCIAFLPILIAHEINVAFLVNDFNISMVASRSLEHFKSINNEFKSNNINLLNYSSIDQGIK